MRSSHFPERGAPRLVARGWPSAAAGAHLACPSWPTPCCPQTWKEPKHSVAAMAGICLFCFLPRLAVPALLAWLVLSTLAAQPDDAGAPGRGRCAERAAACCAANTARRGGAWGQRMSAARHLPGTFPFHWMVHHNPSIDPP